MLAPPNATNAKAARWQGGFAETIKKVEKPKFSRSGFDFQDYNAWLSQTIYWRDSLAARIADARSASSSACTSTSCTRSRTRLRPSRLIALNGQALGVRHDLYPPRLG